jgi:hypothetical protein
MEIDEARWLRLLDALRNSVDSSPNFILLQAAQTRWAGANRDLEKYKARGAMGRPDNPHVAASFERAVSELQQRVTEAQREVSRIEVLLRQASARRAVLEGLVNGVRTWAKAQSPPITLPGDDATRVAGFAAGTVHVPTPAARDARAWP